MIKILYEDKNIAVCVKPVGISSQKDNNANENMISLLKKQLDTDIFVVHRLDCGVGGVMVFAKNKKSASILSEQILNGHFIKEYTAVLCGKAEKGGVLCDYILKNSRLNISKIVNKNSPGSKKSSLEYKPEKFAQKDSMILTLAKIRLFTGRHHQIRVQMANAGFPLYADTKYNPAFLRKKTKENIGLWAEKLSFILPETSEKKTFSEKTSDGIFSLFPQTKDFLM